MEDGRKWQVEEKGRGGEGREEGRGKAAKEAGISGWDWTGTLYPKTLSPQRFHLIRHSTKHISYSMPHAKDLRIELVNEMPKHHHSRADPNRGLSVHTPVALVQRKNSGKTEGRKDEWEGSLEKTKKKNHKTQSETSSKKMKKWCN